MRALALLICSCGRVGFTSLSGDAAGSGSDSGAAGDAAAIDNDAATSPCGATTLLFDDFEDGVVAPEWTVVTGNGLTAAETGGFLQVTFSSNVPASQTGGYRTTQGMDLGAGQNRATINIFNSMLLTEEQRGAAVYRGPSVAYDPVTQRWLRMREVSGTWYFQTSPDGMSYTTVFSEAMEFPLQTSAALTIAAASGSAVNGGGVAQFGSVRVTAP